MADQGSEGKLSPFLRSRRIKAVTPFLKGKILDVGCGIGILAGIVNEELYLGVDVDESSLKVAKNLHPNHNFQSLLPPENEHFNTIIAAAVIEHIPNPTCFLASLTLRLGNSANDSIVCTTPHPSMEWIHSFGSRIGVFSSHANEEHEELLNYSRLYEMSKECNLKIIKYNRFLFGANQLIIFQKNN